MIKKDTLFGELVAEFIGTFILIFIGVGVVASNVLNGTGIGLWELSLVWGMAVTMAIYITGAVSGTHINPAVTITLALFRGFSWKKVVPYIGAQIAGAFAASAVVYGLFNKSFAIYEQTNNIVRGNAESWGLAGVFSTYPAEYLTYANAFMVEVAITAFLLMVILAVGEEKNNGKPASNLAPVMIGLTIAIIGASFGSLTGFAMNPARDFGPKLFTMVAGWGMHDYFWVPIVAPIVGAILGALIYDNLIKKFLVTQVTAEDSKLEKAA